MKDLIRYQHVTSLIAKEQFGTISPGEARELAAWLEEDERHRRQYERLIGEDVSAGVRRFDSIDVEAGWRKYKKRYPARRRWSYRWCGVAAAVVLLVCVGTWQFSGDVNKIVPAKVDILPGTSKAVLVLGDGTERKLERDRREDVIPMNGVIARQEGGEIRYDRVMMDSMKQACSAPVYNTMKIPTGGEFMLVLEDGTKVWLNSETSLRYPVTFTGAMREVLLEGEAYFEVVRDEKRPFIVRTRKRVDVQVLGTSFNLRAYGDEENVETVLEEGSVRMSGDSLGVVLVPGTMGVCNSTGMKLLPVDTELYTAWHKGHFIFQDETLEAILGKLSRWYGMKVFYRNEEVKQLVFSGNVRKYDTMRKLLEALELSGEVCFDVKENTVVVSGK